MTSRYDSIAWRVACRRRNWCGPQEVVCDSDSDSDSDASSVYVFECECGLKLYGEDANDYRYMVTHHGECGCPCVVDFEHEHCAACEAAGCEQFDVCNDCEAKYDKIDEERRKVVGWPRADHE